MANTRRSFGRIAKLPSGRFRARYTGPDAALHNAPRTFSTKMDAEGWLANERRLIDLDTWTPPKERGARSEALAVSVSDWCENVIERKGLRPGSAETYRSILSKRISPFIGDMPIGDVTSSTIDKWIATIAAEFPETAARNSQAYVFLAGAFRMAVEDRLLAASPCVTPKAGRKPKPQRKALLTGEEYVALVSALPGRYRLMAHIMAGCALRLGEVTELRVKDVRFVRLIDEGTTAKIHVARTVSWTSSGPSVGPPKSDAGNRVVTVPPHLVEQLEGLVAERKREGREALVFVNAEGGQVRPQGFRDTFHRAAEKAGRPEVSPHQLRHFGAVQAALAGATLRELMDRLGHATSSMALHYQHSAADRDAEIARRISELNKGAE